MTTNPTYVSRYDQRVKLVENVLKENSALSAEDCHVLAIRLLRALEEIPEKVR
ncbi:DUF6307 family protein [Amycolatopsis orientalis]|uniref:DUF6307 family protein n=1 Tax=Amycolatopsis orientalis TaxID=31958 RepID=UPI0013BE9067|nr:DUF6307 family protein [Amycolatopsis orientalis]